MSQAQKAIALADQITTMAEDTLRVLDRTISSWPGEFRSIVWMAVADIATRRATAARADQ